MKLELPRPTRDATLEHAGITGPEPRVMAYVADMQTQKYTQSLKRSYLYNELELQRPARDATLGHAGL